MLVVSNMWPGRRKSNFGIFVHDRVQAYRELGADVRAVGNRVFQKNLVANVIKYAVLLVRAVWHAIWFRPDVIEGHYLRPTAIVTRIAAAAARRPYVLYAHGSDLIGPFDSLTGWSIRGAAEVHTNSEASASLVRAAFEDLPVHVIPPGVDRDAFNPGLPEPGHIVFVGDLVRHKGVDVLLEALALVPTAQLTVVGDGVVRSSLEAYAAQVGVSDRVRWLGRVHHADVPALMSAAWVVAVPSRADALGQVAVEALSCGVPVVVSNVGGLGSVPTRDIGSVVEPDRADELARALKKWLSISADERRLVGEAARRHSERYDITALASAGLARLGDVAEVNVEG